MTLALGIRINKDISMYLESCKMFLPGAGTSPVWPNKAGPT